MFRHEYGLLFWLHVAVIILAFTAPFLFNMWLVVGAAGLYFLQNMIFDRCILTRLQFGAGKHVKGFCAHYLHKVGFNLRPAAVNGYLDHIQPFITLCFGVFWQWVLGFHPLII